MSQQRAVRRLGRLPDAQTGGASGSPDVVELASGDFAVIGWDITEEIDLSDLPGVHCAPGERAVMIDRQVLLDSKNDIPDA